MTKPKLVTVTDHENNIIAKANAWRDAREAAQLAAEEFYEAMQRGRDEAELSLSQIGDLTDLNKGSVSQMLKRLSLRGGSDGRWDVLRLPAWQRHLSRMGSEQPARPSHACELSVWAGAWCPTCVAHHGRCRSRRVRGVCATQVSQPLR